MKKSMFVVEQAIGVSSTILDVARINAMNSKRKSDYFAKALEICSEIFQISQFPVSNKVSLVLFSDIGFCGSFNKYTKEFLKEKVCIGKKSPNKTIDLCQALNAEVLNNFLGDCYNIDVYFKNFKTQDVDILTFPKYKMRGDKMVSVDSSFPNLYRQYFMEYCINLAMFNENSYRICFMNNALDNCQLEKKKLMLKISRCRQESINKEIALSSTQES